MTPAGIPVPVAFAAAFAGGVGAALTAASGLAPLFVGLAAALAALAGGVIAAFALRSPDVAPEVPPAAAVVPAATMRLDRVLDRLPGALILVDRDLRVRGANAAAAELFGAPDIGDPLVAAVRAPDLRDAAAATLSDGEARALPFAFMRTREERALLAHVRQLDPSPDPKAPAILIVVEDQTRIRSIEEMRENFIANASHELKTPLASIIGFIETLQGPAKDDPAARDRFLGIMGAQAERMKRLVEDLLSLNRIELNAHVRPTGDVDIAALAHETAAAMEPLVKDAGASIAVRAPANGVTVKGDRDQLAQLLTNLIDNAVKYGGDGVNVEVRMADAAPEWPGRTGLIVKDDGPGIAREHLPRLTERFYRVSAAHSRAVGGTGLGLAIAKHIVQRHRGDLSIRSTPGEGAEFAIWLPASSDSHL